MAVGILDGHTFQPVLQRRSTRSTWARHAVAAAAGAMVLAACALAVVSTSNSGRSFLAEEAAAAAAAGGGAAAPAAAAAAAAAAAKVESGEGNPSQVASQIMADSLANHNMPYRTLDSFLAGDEDQTTPPSNREEDYPAQSAAIVAHGQNTLNKLMGKYPPPVDEGGPLPVPSPPSIQRGQPSTSPPPEKPEGKAAAVMPDWKNAGAVPEANAYDKIFDSDAPGALVPLPGHSEASTEANNLVGLNELGPSIRHPSDNGSGEADGFTITHTSDDAFHGSKPSWLPISLDKMTGESSQSASYREYNGKIGKIANSIAAVPGASFTVRTGLDNGAKGKETFTVSTNVDTAFACGDSCHDSEKEAHFAVNVPQVADTEGGAEGEGAAEMPGGGGEGGGSGGGGEGAGGAEGSGGGVEKGGETEGEAQDGVVPDPNDVPEKKDPTLSESV